MKIWRNLAVCGIFCGEGGDLRVGEGAAKKGPGKKAKEINHRGRVGGDQDSKIEL